ncbi:unnamed protein product [Hyaloperonospora brassicae]|uniref:RxLR effector candidate protein n=1 Tax=Hyaloperonospora brassicae TaxID=162125 RepID=A0AAV0TF74_HYABA|nr:unnamed protein product [Hyaloperonospora brassicae]
MKVLSLLALLAATAPLKRVGGLSVQKVATNSSLAETSPFVEDPEEVSITMRAGSDEPEDSGDERTVEWPNLAQKAVSKLAKLANIPLSLETNEMKAFREVQVNEKALEIRKSSNTQKTSIAAPTKAEEDGVVEIALAGLKNTGDVETKTTTTTLSEQQLDGWLKDVVSPGDFLTSLKLHEGHVGAKLEVFDQFLTAYNKKNPGHIDILDFLTLKLGGEGELASVLAKGANSDGAVNAKTLALEEMLLTKWKNEKLSAQDIVDRLKLTETIDDLVSPKLATFLKHIASISGDAKDPADEITLLQMSTNRFGDEAVAVALVRARGDAFLKSHVDKLEIRLVEIWLADGKLPEDVFAMISCYGGEHVLAQVLVWAMAYEGSSKQTLKLERQLLSNWKNEKLKPNDIVRRLRMTDDVKGSAIPKLVMFMKYIATSYRKRWKLMRTLPEMFTERLGDEDMMGALVLASKIDVLKEDIKVLINQVWKRRLAAGEPIDRVYKSLGIGKMESMAFFDQQVEVLKEIMKIYNKSKLTDVDLLTTMTSICGSEENLARILGWATGYEYRSKKALELENLLLGKWRNEKLTPEAVMHRLGMTRRVDEMTGPKLEIFVKFMDMHQKEDPTRELSVLKIFTTYFGHACVADAVAKARAGRLPDAYEKVLEPQQLKIWLAEVRARTAGPSNQHVKELEKELLSSWYSANKSIEEVFALLDMKSHVHKASRDLKFKLLIKYMESKHSWSWPSIFEALEKCYDDDINLALTLVEAYQKDTDIQDFAYEYLTSLFDRWCSESVKPDSEFIKRVKERDAVNWATLVDMYTEYYDEEAADVIHLTTSRLV